MIRNRLAELMFERDIKTVRMAKEIGVSRNTITNTAQNDSEMLRMETINKICQYLNIDPSEFFEFYPFDIDFTIDSENIYINNNDSKIISDYHLNLDLLIDIKHNGITNSIDSELKVVNLTKISAILLESSTIYYEIIFENTDDKKLIVETYNKLSKGMKKILYSNLVEDIKIHLYESLEDNSPNVFVEPINDILNRTEIKITNDFLNYY
ncbi:helix-turn-helix transcriptional regulator [Mammaliicoccus sp. Dog046]|uniref:helix-turn-helix domain-containing protein n=1 Tax=Mammaliicoccus sp. Dog046 TaxID=3034233 RepID=UPI002B2571C6|nr:helix-turn-helix transcriptional regulator [Mammaliicoccus sp. Dog046]WQK85439.1 helix-turn-helix transcriptional regulator [Mammaliicoccus sp. Dog046]